MLSPLINITKRQALLFASYLVLYEFLTYIANDIIMPLMLQVVDYMHTDDKYIASSLSMYVLGGASLQIFLGPLSDRFGRRVVMLFGVAFFFACTILIAFTTNIHQFLLMRFLQGMGLCFTGVVGYAVIQEIFADADAIKLTSLMTNVAIIAPLLGPSTGALLSHHLHWDHIFIIIAATTVISFWGIWVYMPETIGTSKLDGSIIHGSNIALKTVLNNYKVLLTNRKFLFGSLALGVLGIICLAWIGLSPIILVSAGNLTLFEYGLWQIPVFGSFILANILLFYLTSRIKINTIILIGVVISIVGLIICFVLPFMFGSSYYQLLPGILIYFFGYGLCSSPLYRVVLCSTNVSKGTTAALISLIYMSVQGVGVEFANIIFTSHNNLIFGIYSICVGILFILIFLISNILKE